MKRIGLYIPSLSNGGAERVVSRLSNILGKDYEVFIIINEDVIKYEVSCQIINLKIPPQINLIKKSFLPFLRSKKLKKVKKEYHFDCVISFLTNANIVNALSRSKGCTTIVSVRNFSELEKRKSRLSRIKDKLMRLLYRKVDFIIPVSRELERSLIDNYHVNSSKVKTIYNPYDIEEINILSKETIHNEEHERFLSTGKVFVTVGRLSYQKGYWHLIKAFSLLDSDKNTKLLIIGNGSDKKKIEQLIRNLALEERVLLAGYQKNPFKYISRCHSYVTSSLFEGFPNAMVEAMICGCPVISTDCKSGPREILFENLDLDKIINKPEFADYGVIVPEVTMEENWDPTIIEDCDKMIADGMKVLLNNDKLRYQLIKEGKKRAKSFNYELCFKKYSEVIENA